MNPIRRWRTARWEKKNAAQIQRAVDAAWELRERQQNAARFEDTIRNLQAQGVPFTRTLEQWREDQK